MTHFFYLFFLLQFHFFFSFIFFSFLSRHEQHELSCWDEDNSRTNKPMERDEKIKGTFFLSSFFFSFYWFRGSGVGFGRRAAFWE